MSNWRYRCTKQNYSPCPLSNRPAKKGEAHVPRVSVDTVPVRPLWAPTHCQDTRPSPHSTSKDLSTFALPATGPTCCLVAATASTSDFGCKLCGFFLCRCVLHTAPHSRFPSDPCPQIPVPGLRLPSLFPFPSSSSSSSAFFFTRPKKKRKKRNTRSPLLKIISRLFLLLLDLNLQPTPFLFSKTLRLIHYVSRNLFSSSTRQPSFSRSTLYPTAFSRYYTCQINTFSGRISLA